MLFMTSALLQRLSAKQQYTLLVAAFFLLSALAIYALRYPLNPNRIIETFLFWLVLHRLAPRLLQALLYISALVVLLYHPTAALYGRPSFGIIASLISTSASEAGEYLQTIPWHVYIAAVVFSLLLAALARLAGRIAAPQFGWRWLLPLCAVIAAMTLSTARKSYEEGGFPLRVVPLEFIADSYLMPKAYFAELDKLQHDLQLPHDWQVTATQQPYRNYVLLIGESVRADYMSLYGFKIDNTPFLRRRANLVMENQLSPGPNTPISLLYGLNLSHNGGFQIQNNLVSLAKAANMHTVWLSNQGALGKYDTSISAIAHKADEVHFLKTSGYDFGHKTYDSELLPLLQQTLQQPLPAQQNRLIVLHLLGAHPNPCDRLTQPPLHYSSNANTNCYIDSIRATDTLIADIDTLLTKTGQPYSMLYFSDHGLSHDKHTYDKNTLSIEDSVLRHNDHYRQNYHIPLVIINSKQQTQQRNSAQRSGEHLLSGLAQWLGIRSPQFAAEYDFFAPKADTDIRVLDFSARWRSASELADDPPPLADIHHP